MQTESSPSVAVDDAQLAWLDEDLAAVDRTKTPWIVVSSHFPLHHGTVAANAGASASFYTGEVAERFATSGHDFVSAHCDETGNCEETVAEFQAVRQGGLYVAALSLKNPRHQGFGGRD